MLERDVADLLREAIEAKSRELGTRYTYRDLADDSKTHFTTVDKVIQHKRNASRSVIIAWGKALAPHFPTDEALIRAGFMPEHPTLREALLNALSGPGTITERIERAARVLAVEPVPPKRPTKRARQRDVSGKDSGEQPPPDAG